MYLQIDPSDGNPIYLQIIEQVKKAIALGVFEVGKPIPTIREIALELTVNPNTVAKAIKELEREGFLKTYVGKGSFVTEKSSEINKKEGTEKVMKIIEQFIKDAEWLGLDKNNVMKLLEEKWNEKEVNTDE